MIKTEVLVIGAGCAGINAAIAAAKAGKKVLLVEKYGFLGGTSTFILDTMNGFYLPGKDNLKVVSGLGDEIIARLQAQNECFERSNTYGSGTVITYGPEALKKVYMDLCEEHNVELLFHAIAVNVTKQDHTLNSVQVATKNGTFDIEADVFIDASGDGDVAYMAGYEFDGVGGQEHVQSLTTTFRVANIDEEQASTFTKQDMWQWMKEANASGKYQLPREEGSFHKTTLKGCVATNMVRVILDDPTDVFALTKAEIAGQRQVHEYYRFMRDYLPGYQNSVLISSSIQIGVRETRRIIGEYTLTEQDVLSGAKFEDGVVLCGSPIEDHNQTSATKWVYLQENDYYSIPYRTLIPKNSQNLLVAGRCFSATHSAHAGSRSIAQCMGMGQAAGVAASIAIDQKCPVKEISIERLRKQLLAQNVQLEV